MMKNAKIEDTYRGDHMSKSSIDPVTKPPALICKLGLFLKELGVAHTFPSPQDANWLMRLSLTLKDKMGT